MTSKMKATSKMKTTSIGKQPKYEDMEFHMIDMIYATLSMRTQTEKTTFSCKDDWGKSLHAYWSGAKELVKNQDHTWPELTQP